MATTIQISENLQQELKERKLSPNESYEEVIWDLMEDVATVSEETKRELEQARKEIREGKVATLEQVKKELEK
ncbi:MAG: hypothetical protein ISS93_02615 [Candidatus Aenigmarchaeota archaeon]|nr:hypothetical protein [Candidatus Aenigmarchaeota archaeon]